MTAENNDACLSEAGPYTPACTDELHPILGKRLDFSKLDADPVFLAATFAEAARLYSEHPDDLDVRGRFHLLAGYLVGAYLKATRDS